MEYPEVSYVFQDLAMKYLRFKPDTMKIFVNCNVSFMGSFN